MGLGGRLPCERCTGHRGPLRPPAGTLPGHPLTNEGPGSGGAMCLGQGFPMAGRSVALLVTDQGSGSEEMGLCRPLTSTRGVWGQGGRQRGPRVPEQPHGNTQSLK